VALYFENSLLPPDLSLLAAASAVVTGYSREKKMMTVESAQGVELMWGADGALVDGKAWPMLSKTSVRLPPGPHVVEAAARRDSLAVEDLNASLRSASSDGKRIAFEYSSDSRAIVRFDRRPQQMEIDGAIATAACIEGSDCAVMLPRGEHRVSAQ
jgi:hypothetical protein